jgi:hypothetical protein
LADYLKENAISILSLLISSYVLLSNKRTLIKTYRLNRAGVRSEDIELLFIASEQKEESASLKLVLFNPGNVAAIINSLTIYKFAPHPIKILRYIGIKKWQEVEDAHWWPSSEDKFDSIRTLEDEYSNLYVEDYRNIFVNFPGYISRTDYKFFIQTNNGSVERITTIDATKIYFPHAYRKWYHEL